MSDEPRSAVLLRRLALSDEVAIGSIFAGDVGDLDSRELGEKTGALVRLAALVATDSAAPSYQWVVNAALAAGVTEDELADVLMGIAPIVGVARVASAAPILAAALGYELDPPTE